MKFRLELIFALGALAMLGGCVTYPYTSSFTACDNAAGSCYRACEDYEGSADYSRCHADCDYSANQCFASAYEPYRYDYAYSYSSPWSGSYGAWYPDTGYVFSFGVYQNYGYGGRRYYNRRDYDHRHRYDGPGGGSPPPNSGGPRPNPNDPSFARDQGPPRVDRPDEDRGTSQPRRQSPQSQPALPPRQQSQPQPSSEPRPDQGGSPPQNRSSGPRQRAIPHRTSPSGEPDRDKD